MGCPNVVGRNMKRILKEKGIRQNELAYGCDFAPKMVCEWANGHHEPTIYNLKKIADFLECRMEDFLAE